MTTALITGGSGFLGQLLKERLLAENYACINIDLEKDDHKHPNLISILRQNVSAHKRAVSMGAIRLLKWFS
jgi:nucleoside-diphosphate-sugar epimerase